MYLIMMLLSTYRFMLSLKMILQPNRITKKGMIKIITGLMDSVVNIKTVKGLEMNIEEKESYIEPLLCYIQLQSKHQTTTI